MSEALKNINESVANSFTGRYMQKSYIELLHPKQEETRTAEEIIQNIKDGLDELGAKNGRTDIKGTSDA